MASCFHIIKQKARIILGLLSLLALPACLAAPLVDENRELADHGQVFDGAVTIPAPIGYCLDEATSKATANPPVLVFASCQALGQTNTPPPDVIAIVTATVMPGPVPVERNAQPELLTFFQSQGGLSLMSRGARTEISIVDHSKQSDDHFWVLAREDRAPRHLSPWIWFGLTEASGHGVTVSVYPASDYHGDDNIAGKSLFTSFLQRLAKR